MGTVLKLRTIMHFHFVGILPLLIVLTQAERNSSFVSIDRDHMTTQHVFIGHGGNFGGRYRPPFHHPPHHSPHRPPHHPPHRPPHNPSHNPPTDTPNYPFSTDSPLETCLDLCQTSSCQKDRDVQRGCNQMLTCAHGCKLRQLGLKKRACFKKCDRNGQSGRSLTVKGWTFKLAGKCNRRGCTKWPKKKECKQGCKFYKDSSTNSGTYFLKFAYLRF